MVNGEVVRVGAIDLSTADVEYLMRLLTGLARSEKARASAFKARRDLAGERLARLNEWRAVELLGELREWKPVEQVAA